jgi:hypothetical protein
VASNVAWSASTSMGTYPGRGVHDLGSLPAAQPGAGLSSLDDSGRGVRVDQHSHSPGAEPERPQQGVARCSAALSSAGHASQDG